MRPRTLPAPDAMFSTVVPGSVTSDPTSLTGAAADLARASPNALLPSTFRSSSIARSSRTRCASMSVPLMRNVPYEERSSALTRKRSMRTGSATS
jgi:hypothetical protein